MLGSPCRRKPVSPSYDAEVRLSQSHCAHGETLTTLDLVALAPRRSPPRSRHREWRAGQQEACVLLAVYKAHTPGSGQKPHPTGLPAVCQIGCQVVLGQFFLSMWSLVWVPFTHAAGPPLHVVLGLRRCRPLCSCIIHPLERVQILDLKKHFKLGAYVCVCLCGCTHVKVQAPWKPEEG